MSRPRAAHGKAGASAARPLGRRPDRKQGHAVSFAEPEPWPDRVDGAALLDGIASAIRAHVVMPDHCRDLCALWVLHTYLIDRFLISPRLGIRSPTKGCGKTLLLDVLRPLGAAPLAVNQRDAGGDLPRDRGASSHAAD